ncbi:MAG: geranyl-CoA carboxylase alpha subunit [Hyphomicrobiaceae bacterium]|jgi:geranyl-CoA carboxylase alpha subunit
MNQVASKLNSLTSVLVANRGEIAVRVIRTARALGLRTIAVYSEADADAPHVHAADEAVCIGPAAAGESYLVAENVIEAARATGAESIHPGYGFLSENAAFAIACEQAGLVFIGPTAEAIEVMGNKAESKRRMIAAGVPCVPGYEGVDQADEAFVDAAAKIGFPVMVKAAAGGGGRGMRLVTASGDLVDALALARSEAENAFGSGELILEKAVQRPRHVEIQIFADSQGSTVHLGERDCSVQRRHQKVIEEAPCPVMTDDLRQRMGASAVEAARSIGYRGAGTVEFLLDAEGNFYFLEMNTRLQVEHPVTEMITGHDLVALQIAVAEGQPLGFSQSDVVLNGSAIEVRLYAEDTASGFLPSTGTVGLWQPSKAEGLRYDSGIASGQEVSPFYDPMLAKVIAWGPTREIARRRLVQGLCDTALFGLRSNRDFLIAALQREAFVAGQATTAFIADEFTPEELRHAVPDTACLAIAAVLEFVAEHDNARHAALACSTPLDNWASTEPLTSRYRYVVADNTVEFVVSPTPGNGYRVHNSEVSVVVGCENVGANKATLTVDGNRHSVLWQIPEPGRVDFSFQGRNWSCRNLNASIVGADAEVGGGSIVAPMHGALLEVLVAVGDRVEPGTRLAILEAMKMQHELEAEVCGVVTEVLAAAGTQVAADELLMTIEVDSDS